MTWKTWGINLLLCDMNVNIDSDSCKEMSIYLTWCYHISKIRVRTTCSNMMIKITNHLLTNPLLTNSFSVPFKACFLSLFSSFNDENQWTLQQIDLLTISQLLLLAQNCPFDVKDIMQYLSDLNRLNFWFWLSNLDLYFVYSLFELVFILISHKRKSILYGFF